MQSRGIGGVGQKECSALGVANRERGGRGRARYKNQTRARENKTEMVINWPQVAKSAAAAAFEGCGEGEINDFRVRIDGFQVAQVFFLSPSRWNIQKVGD